MFTVKQAAEYLKISRWLAYELIKRGKLPCIRLGKAIRIKKEDLDNMAAFH